MGKPAVTTDTAVLSTELVPFHGSMLEAGKADGKVWVIVRRVCEAIEIGFTGQHDRLSNPARAPWATIRVMRMVGADGKIHEVFCIDMDSVPMWLATINASRVAPHLREKLVLFQKEAAKVLRDHFLGKAPVAPPPVEPQPTHSQVLQWRPDWPRRRPGGRQPRQPTRRPCSPRRRGRLSPSTSAEETSTSLNRAGLAQPGNIRQPSRAKLGALKELGPLRAQCARNAVSAGFGTREDQVDEYWLTERQALYLVQLLRSRDSKEMSDNVFASLMDLFDSLHAPRANSGGGRPSLVLA